MKEILSFCFHWIIKSLLIGYFVCFSLFLTHRELWAQDPDGFTDDFPISECRFKTTGENPYFILRPGYQLILQGQEDGETIDVLITVLHETQRIVPEGTCPVRTRVVEEREWIDGELVEVSKNFYAICRKTNSVYYFGEDVDIYKDDEIVSHDGAWRAGDDGARPGLMMPGTFLMGSRYYQEVAPEAAMDRAQHTAMGLTIPVGSDTFYDCVEITETTPLDSGESIKVYCPGVGLIQDDELKIVSFGFAAGNDTSENKGCASHKNFRRKQ